MASATAPTLSHLFMHVSDLDRARDFYTRVLGLRLLWEEPGYVRVGGEEGFHIGMEQRDAPEVGAPGIELVVRVPDVYDAYERLYQMGVRFDAPPRPQEWGAVHAWFRDPDGHRLSIFST